jgi:hypothetical protein
VLDLAKVTTQALARLAGRLFHYADETGNRHGCVQFALLT